MAVQLVHNCFAVFMLETAQLSQVQRARVSNRCFAEAVCRVIATMLVYQRCRCFTALASPAWLERNLHTHTTWLSDRAAQKLHRFLLSRARTISLWILSQASSLRILYNERPLF